MKKLEALAIQLSAVPWIMLDRIGEEGTQYVHRINGIPVVTMIDEDGDGIIVGYVRDSYVWGRTDFSRGHEVMVLKDMVPNFKSSECPDAEAVIALLRRN